MIAQSINPIITLAMPLTPVSTSAKRSVRVLVIDDEEPLRLLLCTILQNNGYAATAAGSAKEALQIFRTLPFDVVLVDVMMPEMDGHTLCKELRKVSDTPVIMISAMNRPQSIIEGFAAGADDYINKPFQIREVDLRIKALLRCVERCNAVHAPHPA